MKLLSAVTASLLLAFSATAAHLESARNAPVSPAVARGAGGSLTARADSILTLYTETDFEGTSVTLVGNAGTCYGPLGEPWVSHLLSAKAASGLVCFLWTNSNGCSNCGACIDDQGFEDMTDVPAVHYFTCEVADRAGCSNANSCTFH
ncbi:Ectomycorrhiza-regulated small secreted protein [Mycena sanguinolenta]|uniref:Ectomycorrhiza-regulated small secreted protein n=1 Tax=Mycena sanguinolenta TaxID=230812 RepID=A0A8H6ZGK6_9AGAR|nr:Ectomycorrhiza-regulated small secreted protein [Mycena sanguinolenta]